ncbi:hypothetical protein NMG60_11001810 [Bertholletia excelsa]
MQEAHFGESSPSQESYLRRQLMQIENNIKLLLLEGSIFSQQNQILLKLLPSGRTSRCPVEFLFSFGRVLNICSPLDSWFCWHILSFCCYSLVLELCYGIGEVIVSSKCYFLVMYLIKIQFPFASLLCSKTGSLTSNTSGSWYW